MDLAIGDVAERTGVSVATLRAWEARYGFPSPDRRSSGHRRYSDADVAAIERLLRARSEGLSLVAAIERARRGDPAEVVPPTIFAGLRARHPDLVTHDLPKRAMLVVSRAIEDETFAAGRASLVFGSFQQSRFFEASADRWRALASVADAAVVLADFGGSAPSVPTPVDVPTDDVATREWAVIADGPASAVLVGWEHPAHGPRRFEAVWSADPIVVRDAATVALAVAAEHVPSIAGIPATLPTVDDDPVAALRRATALTNRIVAGLA